MSSNVLKVPVIPTKSQKPLQALKTRWNRLRFSTQERFHGMRGRRIVHFMHIGKTGGTAVKHALESHLITPAFLIRRHGHQTRLRQIPTGHGVIFFLRDPQARFISGFYSRFREGRPRFNNPWRPAERIIFERFPTPNNLARALSSADNDERSHAEAAMRTISHVRDSYMRWFESEEYFSSRLSDIFFIGFQERLSEDFQRLKTKLGLPQELELPDDDVLTHRSPANLDRRLDDEAADNLRRWYAADFRFLELCRAHATRINAGS